MPFLLVRKELWDSSPITEVTLKLAHMPEKTAVAVTTSPTMRDAASAAAQVIYQGIPVGAVDLLNDVQMDVINGIGVMGMESFASPLLQIQWHRCRRSGQY